MLDITKDILSLTTFRRRSGDLMKQLKRDLLRQDDVHGLVRGGVLRALVPEADRIDAGK